MKKGNQPDQSGFVPTTYDRTQLTYDEAVKFAENMKIIRKRISEASHARMSERTALSGTTVSSCSPVSKLPLGSSSSARRRRLSVHSWAHAQPYADAVPLSKP